MADFLGRKNIFYEARNYNATAQPITATQDEALIYPLLRDAGNYAVAVAKATIPLQLVPLRKSNLPLKTYQVGLQQGNYSGTAFVRQLNSTTNNFLFSQNGLEITTYVYNNNGTLVSSGVLDVSPYMNYLFGFLVDDYLNFYCNGSTDNSNNADTLYIISNTSQVLGTYAYTNIKSSYINGSQTLYIADETPVGCVINVFNNLNSATSVVLTQIASISTDFAGAPLANVVFVVATLQSTIVGHDTNILTYYNQQYEPTTDYTIQNVSRMTSANALNGSGTLIVADTTQTADLLFGTQSDNIFSIDSGTQLTSALQVINNVAILSNGFAFYVGSDFNTYFTTWQIASPPITPSIVNSTTPISVISANKIGLYASRTSGEFLVWNMDLNASPSNAWYQYATTQQVDGNNIISMDWNQSTNTIIAVGADFNLYKSHIPVYPLNFGFVNNGSLSVNGASNNSFYIGDPTWNTHSLVSNELTNVVAYAVSNNGTYYSIEGTAGNQQVYKRSQLNYSLTQIAVYNLVQTSGNMKGICIVGNYLVVIGTNNFVYYYTLDTNTLVDLFNYGADNVVSICSVDNDHLLGLGYNSGNEAFIVIKDLNLASQLDIKQINTVPNPVITSVIANPNDVNAGTSAVFYSINYNGSNTGRIEKLTYGANYASSTTTLITDETGVAGFSGLACNSTFGLLFYLINVSGTVEINMITQASNYDATNATVMGDVSVSAGTTGLVISPNLDGVIGWDALTSNKQAISVSVSKVNTNTLFISASGTETLFNGTLIDDTVNFTELTQFTGAYSGISSAPNTTQNAQTTLRTFTISNQQPISTVILSNQIVSSIAKNEINLLGEFLVPTNGTTKISSYSPTLTQNYQLPLSGESFIFAKNGEDIDAGAVDIFSYSVLINAINVAFQEAYVRLSTNNPSPLTEAPTISLDYTTGLCTLSYSADYTNSTSNGILFNNALTQLITFNPYRASVSLPGLYRIILPVGSTSYTQTAKTIFQFNLLDKIGIQSNTIFVSDSYFGNNQTNRIISTIDVPTTEFLENTGQTLYFQPNFMRPYTLSSTNSIDRVQIDILFSYRDFTSYNLQLAPQANFTVLLDFIRKM